MKLDVKTIHFNHIKIMLSLVGNKIEITHEDSIRVILDVFKQAEILEVEDCRKSKWCPSEYTVENIKNTNQNSIRAICTFADCREAVITYNKTENVYYCLLKIWDGDNGYGHRTNLRVKIKFMIPEEYIRMNLITRYILWEYNALLEEQYATHLAQQKELWQIRMHELHMEFGK